MGQKDEALEIKTQLLADLKSRYVMPTIVASLQAAFGERWMASGLVWRHFDVAVWRKV